MKIAAEIWPSSEAAPLFILRPPGRAAAAPVPVTFVPPLLPVLGPGPAVFLVPVSGAGARAGALVA